jgi:hypothetical protein
MLIQRIALAALGIFIAAIVAVVVAISINYAYDAFMGPLDASQRAHEAVFGHG